METDIYIYSQHARHYFSVQYQYEKKKQETNVFALVTWIDKSFEYLKF